MGAAVKKKFSSQANPKILLGMKKIAEDEGRQFQALLEEAMVEYLANHKQRQVRSSVMAHFDKSVEKNRRLGELLAK